jgi:hypothetical protein
VYLRIAAFHLERDDEAAVVLRSLRRGVGPGARWLFVAERGMWTARQ